MIFIYFLFYLDDLLVSGLQVPEQCKIIAKMNIISQDNRFSEMIVIEQTLPYMNTVTAAKYQHYMYISTAHSSIIMIQV